MPIIINDDGKSLIVAGAILFLLGLLQGVGIPMFRNRRMALSGHLGAVQSGMALMLFGLVWSLLELEQTWSQAALIASIVSYYLIWMGITLAAITGASKALPIAGQGFSAGKIPEYAVTVVETIGVVLALISGFLIVWGLI